jgi:four helix bundle protein
MVFQKFEDIIAWQKGQDLAVLAYEVFSKNKDFDFKDQICRASVSVSNNIAEGFDRSSDKDFTRFLYISMGSNSEVRSMLHLAKRLKYIDESEYNKMYLLSNEIGRLLRGLIKSLS